MSERCTSSAVAYSRCVQVCGTHQYNGELEENFSWMRRDYFFWSFLSQLTVREKQQSGLSHENISLFSEFTRISERWRNSRPWPPFITGVTFSWLSITLYIYTPEGGLETCAIFAAAVTSILKKVKIFMSTAHQLVLSNSCTFHNDKNNDLHPSWSRQHCENTKSCLTTTSASNPFPYRLMRVPEG